MTGTLCINVFKVILQYTQCSLLFKKTFFLDSLLLSFIVLLKEKSVLVLKSVPTLKLQHYLWGSVRTVLTYQFDQCSDM